MSLIQERLKLGNLIINSLRLEQLKKNPKIARHPDSRYSNHYIVSFGLDPSQWCVIVADNGIFNWKYGTIFINDAILKG